MPKRPKTHIYVEFIQAPVLKIGDELQTATIPIELYERSLVLTADIKRLPLLLGGSLKILLDASLESDLQAAGLDGFSIHVVLLNGDYSGIFIEDSLFRYVVDLLGVAGRRKDVLLVGHAHIQRDAVTNNYYNLVIDNDSWDFEGEVVLYDTISLVIFAEATGAAAGSPMGSYAWAEAILEIDWKPISTKELDEFIRESVFAREGEGS